MEGCGIVAPATNRAAESTYAKPGLARIQWRPLFHRRWSISPAATTWAVTGVRDSAGVGLQLAFERTEGTGGSYEAAGARRDPGDLESTRELLERAEELRGARFAGHGDGRSSVLAGTAATARERAGGQRGNIEELRGVATVASGSSGRHRRRRIDSGGPRWPRRGKTSGRRFGASPVA